MVFHRTRLASQSSRPCKHNSFSSMLVKKCDNCKKETKGRNKAVVVGLGWPEFSRLPGHVEFRLTCQKEILSARCASDSRLLIVALETLASRPDFFFLNRVRSLPDQV